MINIIILHDFSRRVVFYKKDLTQPCLQEHRTNEFLTLVREIIFKTEFFPRDVVNLDEPESDVSEHIEEIIRDNCTWAEMERHWDASKNFRLVEITKAESTVDILAKWKQYKNPMGFKLVSLF